MSDTTASAEAKTQGEKTARKRRRSGKQASLLNLKEIRQLAEMVDEHGFTEFEFENEDIRVRLSKMTAQPAVQQFAAPPPIQSFTPPASAAAPKAESEKPTQPAQAEDDLNKITSPIVGTFYRSPGPDKEPYVSEGSKVTPETVVCIVEAMKLMNEIQAETTGQIVKIYAENGQPVEYGQPLFGIRK